MKNISVNRYNIALILLFVICLFSLFYASNSMSIGYKEALIFFDQTNLLHYIIKFSTTLFGQNDIALRLPFILFYTFSGILLYKITQKYFQNRFDQFISVAIFMLLPGVLSSALMVNESIIVIFSVLLYLYLYEQNKSHNYLLLVIFLFIDNSFAIFFLALFFFSLKEKNNTLLATTLILFAFSMYMYGFNTHGRPQGHFLDILGIYASIFSPFIFLYFFYTQYRGAIRGTKNIYWYISVTALGFSLLLSFRQRIYIEDFAPYVVISIPFMVRLFLHSLRVRLPRFQKKHLNIAYGSLFVLIISSIVLVYHMPIYLLLDKPEKHFAYKYHHARDIAEFLKESKIDYVYSSDIKLIKRLQFYGIHKGYDYFITTKPQDSYIAHFKITYNQYNLIEIFVTKLNNK
jgi:hypothetical protein